MFSTKPPLITVGACRYFWQSPTRSEKKSTPTGIVHRLDRTKSFSTQMALVRNAYRAMNPAVKAMAMSAMHDDCQKERACPLEWLIIINPWLPVVPGYLVCLPELAYLFYSSFLLP